MIALAVELGQFRFEVGAHVPHDLFQPHEVARAKTACRYLAAKTTCACNAKKTVPASADIDCQ